MGAKSETGNSLLQETGRKCIEFALDLLNESEDDELDEETLDAIGILTRAAIELNEFRFR